MPLNTKKVEDAIVHLKITKAEVIRRADWTRPTLDKILSGKDFKVSNLEKLASILNVKIGYLFDEVDESVNLRHAGRDLVEHGNIEHKETEYAAGAVAEADLKREVEHLRERIADKEEIITALRAQIDTMRHPSTDVCH